MKSEKEPSVAGETASANGSGANRAPHARWAIAPKGSLLDRFFAVRYWILAVAFAVGGIETFNLYRDPPLYSSSVLFLVDDQSTGKSDPSIPLLERSPSLAGLYHGATSTEMIDHLIERFDLYHYYGISSSEPLGYERVNNDLLDAISVRIVDQNGVVISVQDKDRQLAAAMANEIFLKLQEMTERQVIDDMERKIALYTQVIIGAEQRSTEQSDKLVSIASEFKRLSAGRDPQAKADQLSTLNFQLAELVARLSASNDELLKAQRGEEMAAALLRKENLPIIHLVRKAVQDVRTSKVMAALKALLLIPLAAVAAMLISITFWCKHGHEFTSYFTGSIDQPSAQLDVELGSAAADVRTSPLRPEPMFKAPGPV